MNYLLIGKPGFTILTSTNVYFQPKCKDYNVNESASGFTQKTFPFMLA